ncbi:MAG: acylneuraminate cytidylyltransferase family protein [Parcubacteria group bacterium]|jgi:CMP-N,N'-diacetyllegionaminic acid synthase
MKKKYKILAVITARSGSKGIPGKNLKKLRKKPLVVYTIQVAKKSKLISHLIVSTDDKKIADISKKLKVQVPFLRPAALASDTASHIDVMKHANDFMEKKLGIIFDYVVILQPTSPLREAKDIDETLKKIINNKQADSAVSLVEIDCNHPIKIKKIIGDRVFPYCIKENVFRRQDLPTAYKRSGAVYVMTRDLLMKKNKIFGNNIVGHIVPKERSIDIDNEFDWLKAEYMMKKINNKIKLK